MKFLKDLDVTFDEVLETTGAHTILGRSIAKTAMWVTWVPLFIVLVSVLIIETLYFKIRGQ